MEPQQSQPVEPQPVVPTPEEQHPLIHNYKDDLEQAMSVTDAPAVQSMLADARERENEAAVSVVERSEEKWYSLSSIVLLVLTLIVIAVGIYYYTHLTVPVTPAASVGVFPTTNNIVATGTTIQDVISTLTRSTTLQPGKPVLVNIVSDSTTNTLLSNVALYKFIDADVPEPLQSTISVARLGAVNINGTVLPFIIATVPDPEKASQEFSIAEPQLLQMFAPALNINLTAYSDEVGQTFQSNYFYNLPVRSLTTIASITSQQTIIFLYGYINNNTIVIANNPAVLKAVYDTVIIQH